MELLRTHSRVGDLFQTCHWTRKHFFFAVCGSERCHILLCITHAIPHMKCAISLVIHMHDWPFHTHEMCHFLSHLRALYAIPHIKCAISLVIHMHETCHFPSHSIERQYNSYIWIKSCHSHPWYFIKALCNFHCWNMKHNGWYMYGSRIMLDTITEMIWSFWIWQLVHR